MSRFEKESVELDYEETLAFFRARVSKSKSLSHVGVTAYQDHAPDLAIKRDLVEKEQVLPLLTLKQDMRVLDLGCGSGRWLEELGDKVHAYLGVDFAEELLELGRERFSSKYPNAYFQQLCVTQLEAAPLSVSPPFDRILVSGLCLYLNDHDLAALMEYLPRISAPNAQIYMREPISLLSHRLSLKAHYSEELDADYHAIYRTTSELQTLFQAKLVAEGFKELKAEALYPDALNNRKETQQYYYLYERSQK